MSLCRGEYDQQRARCPLRRLSGEDCDVFNRFNRDWSLCFAVSIVIGQPGLLCALLQTHASQVGEITNQVPVVHRVTIVGLFLIQNIHQWGLATA